MYRTARFNYAIPCKLEEQALRHTRSFYYTIGYNGVFALAVDATAVIPTMRVKGNKIIGLATECDVIVSSAQDILNVVKNRNTSWPNKQTHLSWHHCRITFLLSYWLLVQFLKVKIIHLSDIGITKLFCGVPAIK